MVIPGVGSASRAFCLPTVSAAWLALVGNSKSPLRAPGLPRGVDVLTQRGLLQSRQALTKNTFPVRRELPHRTLLFCFPLRPFFPQALPWSPSRVLPPVPALGAGGLISDGVKQSWWEVPGQGVSAAGFANKGL